MCLLVVCDAHSTPSREELLQGACRNPDGFGFAIMAGDEIISERTMLAEDSIDRFLELRAQYPEAYALWHCRIATHGEKNVENCHPFAVGGDTQTYLAHNGMLSLPMYADDERSDTRYFAEEVLPAMGGVSALDDPAIFHILEQWSTGSKVVVITVDPAAKFNLYILNEKAGQWDSDGVWWSNTYHRPAKTYYGSGYGKGGWGLDDSFYDDHYYDKKAKCYVPLSSKAVSSAPKELTSPTTGGEVLDLFSDELSVEVFYDDESYEYKCDWCENPLTFNTITEVGGCPNCLLCLDCGDAQGFCLCYQPPAKDYSISHWSDEGQLLPTNK